MVSTKALITEVIMTAKLSPIGRKIFLPLFLGVWMVSCSPINPTGWAQDYLDIAKLEEISNQRTVNIQGIVVNVAPFLEGGAYQVQDQTGKVWVKTDGPLPKKGTVLSVRAEVAYEPIFIGPEKLGESYLLQITKPQPESTASGDNDASSPPEATATVQASPENTEAVTPDPGQTIEVVTTETNPGTPDNAASGATAISVTNPEAPRPIAKPAPSSTPPKVRPNLDDQFLPHKRHTK